MAVFGEEDHVFTFNEAFDREVVALAPVWDEFVESPGVHHCARELMGTDFAALFKQANHGLINDFAGLCSSFDSLVMGFDQVHQVDSASEIGRSAADEQGVAGHFIAFHQSLQRWVRVTTTVVAYQRHPAAVRHHGLAPSRRRLVRSQPVRGTCAAIAGVAS